MLVARSHWPRRVRRAPSELRADSLAVGWRMVRNFMSLKILACSPGRSWRKKTGRPMLAHMPRAAALVMGALASKTALAAPRSKALFPIL